MARTREPRSKAAPSPVKAPAGNSESEAHMDMAATCPFCGKKGTRADAEGQEFCLHCGERVVHFPDPAWD